MKVAIVGSRGFKNLPLVAKYIRDNKNWITTVVTGGAVGVDSTAETTALALRIKVELYLPDWQTFGRSAGPRRNRLIVENSDRVVAFWDGKSRGTLSSINFAKEYNKPLEIIQDN